MTSLDRWRITGLLTVRTPLHVGSGVPAPLNAPRKEAFTHGREVTSVGGVATAHDGAAYIPASSLKGCLRSWLKLHTSAGADALIMDLFGYQDSEKPGEGCGGILEFHDCFATLPNGFAVQGECYWDSMRKTCISVGVAIDRMTRTAADKLLYHYEYVPAEVVFTLTIDAQGATIEGIQLLLRALSACNLDADGVAFGADTAGGDGKLTWKPESVFHLPESQIAAWLETDGLVAGFATLPLRADSKQLLAGAAQDRTATRRPLMVIDLQIQIAGNFLVNDPGRTGRRDDNGEHSRAFRRSRGGQAILPPRSLQGALRSQAERIARTLGGLKAVSSIKELNLAGEGGQTRLATELCPVSRLFGAPGWRKPMRCSAFEQQATVEQAEEAQVVQDFVAIDRFTGGVSGDRKFDAEAMYHPLLKGSIVVDLAALESTRAGAGTLALLALTLRDLWEGDVVLGSAGAKGYGAVEQVACAGVRAPAWNELPDSFRLMLEKSNLAESTWADLIQCRLTPAVTGWLQIGIDQLKLEAESYARRP